MPHVVHPRSSDIWALSARGDAINVSPEAGFSQPLLGARVSRIPVDSRQDARVALWSRWRRPPADRQPAPACRLGTGSPHLLRGRAVVLPVPAVAMAERGRHADGVIPCFVLAHSALVRSSSHGGPHPTGSDRDALQAGEQGRQGQDLGRVVRHDGVASKPCPQGAGRGAAPEGGAAAPAAAADVRTRCCCGTAVLLGGVEGADRQAPSGPRPPA